MGYRLMNIFTQDRHVPFPIKLNQKDSMKGLFIKLIEHKEKNVIFYMDSNNKLT